MTITTFARVHLLLTARLGQPGTATLPLDAVELDRLSAWLKRTRLKPVDLLEPELLERLSWAPDAPVPLDRLAGLLRRSAALDAVLDRWDRSGLWVIGRDDPDYPRRVKRRLRDASPALLFGRGDRLLLNRGGIAMVGGDADDADAVAYAAGFAVRAAAAGLATVSGLGNPVEDAAVDGSLSQQGFAVAVLPGDLHGQAVDARLRASADRLVLVSETEPGCAGKGSARCLYGVSDAALLVGVGRGSDRWADTVGAIEKDWVPHWVRAGDPEAGTLIRLGAHPVADDEGTPRALLSPPRPVRSSVRRIPGPAFPAPAPQPVLSGFAEAAAPFPTPPPPTERGTHLRLVELHPRPAASLVPASQPEPDPSFYELFGRRVLGLLRSGPLGASRIAEAMDLTRQQAEAWLLRAEGDGRVQLDPETRLYRLP